MSHLTKIDVQLKDGALLKSLANCRGWEIKKQDKFINSYSKETVSNPTVFYHRERAKLVLDQNGTPQVDEWSMGNEYKKFLQDYSFETIKRTAAMDGASVREVGVDAQGNKLVEVVYI